MACGPDLALGGAFNSPPLNPHLWVLGSTHWADRCVKAAKRLALHPSHGCGRSSVSFSVKWGCLLGKKNRAGNSELSRGSLYKALAFPGRLAASGCPSGPKIR